jgi:hypothetical protein
MKSCRSFKKKHPNIWIFINKIKDEEAGCSLKYLRVENATLRHRPRNTKGYRKEIMISYNAK